MRRSGAPTQRGGREWRSAAGGIGGARRGADGAVARVERKVRPCTGGDHRGSSSVGSCRPGKAGPRSYAAGGLRARPAVSGRARRAGPSAGLRAPPRPPVLPFPPPPSATRGHPRTRPSNYATIEASRLPPAFRPPCHAAAAVFAASPWRRSGDAGGRSRARRERRERLPARGASSRARGWAAARPRRCSGLLRRGRLADVPQRCGEPARQGGGRTCPARLLSERAGPCRSRDANVVGAEWAVVGARCSRRAHWCELRRWAKGSEVREEWSVRVKSFLGLVGSTVLEMCPKCS
jgi:hypothetical protein